MSKSKIYKLFKILISFNFAWYKALFLYGTAPGLEHRAILQKTRKVKTIIDIGANKGQFALFANYFYPGADIFCFEPIKSPFSILNKIFKNNGNVYLTNSAVGNDSGKIQINVSKQEDSSSILEITKKQELIFPGTYKKKTEIVNLIMLDKEMNSDQLQEEILIKIDVQGFELEVLKGSEKILTKSKFVYVESSFVELYKNQSQINDLIKFLIERNFILDGVYNISYDKKNNPIQGDFLFLNRQ